MSKFIGLLGILLLGQCAQAEVLLDPRTRDESITNTEITVAIEKLPSGIFQYTYELSSNSENKGTILNFALDISCDQELDSSAMPVVRQTNAFMGDKSDGQHVPIVFNFSESEYVYIHGIGDGNIAYWGVGLVPGDKAYGLRIFSPAPPQPITYRLTPYMNTDGWDYDSYEEGDPTVPWISDFIVSGMVDGPGCPTGAPPSK